jgi:hypothetical protein
MSARASPDFPAPEVAAAVGGAQPLGWDAVVSRGYGRVTAHWRVRLARGRTVFVKQALTDEAREWLRKERLVYESVQGSFMPAYHGFHDDGSTVLVLEDLTAADWPPPWSKRRVDAVLAALEELHAARPPEGIASLEAERDSVTGWQSIATDPEPLLATALCSRAWLDEALPVLLGAAAGAELAGDELIHFDVRSDNLCFVDGQAVLVDWNLAAKGNGWFDVAFWLPSLTLEGGPHPWEVLPAGGPLAAGVAGFFASRAGLPAPAGAPTVREFQRAQAAVALRWAARELGLAAPA